MTKTGGILSHYF